MQEIMTNSRTDAFISFLARPDVSPVVQGIIIPLLIALGVMLPPVSLGQRVFESGFSSIPSEGGTLLDPDGTQLTLLPPGLNGEIKIRFTSFPRIDFLEGIIGPAVPRDALRGHSELELQSPVYAFDLHGAMPQDMLLSIPIPNDSEPWKTLDLYGWDGEDWVWLPHTLLAEEGRLESRLSFLPQMVGVMQNKGTSPLISAELLPSGVLPTNTEPLMMVESPGLFLENDGVNGQPTIGGEVAPLAGSDLPIIPILENIFAGVVRDDLTHNILSSPELRGKHISEITSHIADGGYGGIIIDYRGITPDLEVGFSDFIAELAASLHAQDKLLWVKVEPAVWVSSDAWDTAGYNWLRLGESTDFLQIPLPLAPQAYAPGGEADSFLDSAAGMVERSKIQILLTAYSQQHSPSGVSFLSYVDSLTLWGQSFQIMTPEIAGPGEMVKVEVASAPTMQFLSGPGVHWFTTGEETVYLEDGESMAYKLGLASYLHLGGVSLEGLLVGGVDGKVWQALEAFQATSPSLITSQFALLFSIEDEHGQSITSPQALSPVNPGSWEAEEPGEYTVALSVSDDGGETVILEAGNIPISVAAPAPARPVAAIETAQPAPTPPPAPPPPSVSGTGFDYGIQVHPYGGTDIGQLVGALQQLGMRWVKFQVRWDWIEASQGNRDWNNNSLEVAVNAFHGAGIKILFSVVAAPPWSRGVKEEAGPPDDNNIYAAFVSDLLSHFKGRVQAIEVMNETNLRREWHTGRPLNAGEYIDLLCRAYHNLKAVDPSIIVVSGAPTPTGWNDAIIAIDDREYLKQMYAAGLRGCSDAIGVHPSGYLSSPDAHWPESDLPDQGYDNHPSFYFRNTIEDYYNIMRANGDGGKKLWATEWGWGSCDGLGPAPGDYSYFCTNSEQEQADYIVRAFQIARDSGYMGVMFLWQLNYAAVCGPGCEQGFFGIVRPDWSHRPAFDAIASMPK